MQETGAALQIDQRAAGRRSLADVCARLARELEFVRQSGAGLEQCLCNAADSWGLDSERVRELQQLDQMIQHLAALRDFTAAMARALDDARDVDLADAFERITLSAVKARLAGADGAPAAGSVEMF